MRSGEGVHTVRFRETPPDRDDLYNDLFAISIHGPSSSISFISITSLFAFKSHPIIMDHKYADESTYVEDFEAQKPSAMADDYVPDTEEERKLVRKIDLYLLPAIWGMYLLSYMDRTK